MSFDLTLKSFAAQVTPATMHRLRQSVEGSDVLRSCEPRFHDPAADARMGLEELDEVLEEGEASEDQYAAYCREHNLDPASDRSAGMFLQKLWGVDVLVIHLTNDPARVAVAFAELRQVGEDLGLVVHDPQAGTDISASYSSPLPPGF